jgi:hypothetical protein
MICASSTALHARETASYYASLSTRRGRTPHSVAPLRRFYKRVARRAERHSNKRVDVDAAILDVTCDYCGRVDCIDVWCGDHNCEIDADIVVNSVPRGAFHDAFASYGDDFDDGFDDFDLDVTADRDARAWRDIYDDLND